MTPFFPILVMFVTAAAPLLARRLGRLVAIVPLAAAGLLVAFVFSEDTYRANGLSRWDTYRSPGGALGPMFVATLVLLLSASAVLALASARRILWIAASLTTLVALFLGIPTIAGFSSN